MRLQILVIALVSTGVTAQPSRKKQQQQQQQPSRGATAGARALLMLEHVSGSEVLADTCVCPEHWAGNATLLEMHNHIDLCSNPLHR
jgi:hypothetical protein